jgi:hypothetical protein
MKLSKIVITGLLEVLFFSNFKEPSKSFQDNLIEVYFLKQT